MNVGPTWNSITGTGISVTSLMGQKNCSGSQSADGIFMWTVVCPPGATASWTLTATANGTVKCEAQAAVLATADAADHRKLTYTGDAVIAVDLSSHATCDSRTSLTARVSDPKSATGWTTKTANGTTAYCTTKSEIVQASLSVACPSGTATGTTEAVAGGNVGAPLVFTGNVDLNGDGAPDYTVSWSDMGAPGVPKPPPAGDPAGPVIGGTDGSPYGGPNPNGSIPGWEPAPFEPPTGYTPGSPPPSNG